MSWFSKKPEIPVAYKSYAESVSSLKKSSTPLPDQKFIVLDTETTGLDLKKDEIVSIGFVPMKGFKISISDSAEWILLNMDSTGKGAEFHEIIPSDERIGMPSKEAAEKLLRVLEGAVLVGHHIRFDAEMLNKWLLRELNVPLLNPTYDTAHLYRRVKGLPYTFEHGDPMGNALDKICLELGIPMDDRHTALGDAAATAYLFMRLLKQLQSRGISSIKDLLKR